MHDLLKARFAMVRKDFDQAFGRIKDADLTWAPSPGMPTIGDLLFEISRKEIEAQAWLRTGLWPDDEEGETPATVAGWRALFDSVRATTYAYIDSHSEEDMEANVSNPEGWWEALRIPECPKSEIFRNIAAHEWYHTAQLTTYLWIRGDNPNAW